VPSSTAAGWRSLNLEVLTVAGETDRIELPPIDAQLVDLQVRGSSLVVSRRGGRWVRGLDGPGVVLHHRTPRRDLRWRSPAGDAHVTQIRLLLFQSTLTRVADEV
jgi:hypothetical protein